MAFISASTSTMSQPESNSIKDEMRVKAVPAVVIPDEVTPVDNTTDGRPYPVEYEGHFSSLMIKHDEISNVVKLIAKKIHDDYKGSRPVMLCVLKGACPFFQHLLDALQDLQQGFYSEFIRISSYEGSSSTGNVKVGGGVDFANLTGKHVIIVEDIIDTGTTLSHLLPTLMDKAGPASVQVCTLLSKRLNEPAKCEAKYVGFSIPNHFIVGYGLDYNELYRDVRDIYVISQKGIEFDASGLK